MMLQKYPALIAFLAVFILPTCICAPLSHYTKLWIRYHYHGEALMTSDQTIELLGVTSAKITASGNGMYSVSYDFESGKPTVLGLQGKPEKVIQFLLLMVPTALVFMIITGLYATMTSREQGDSNE